MKPIRVLAVACAAVSASSLGLLSPAALAETTTKVGASSSTKFCDAVKSAQGKIAKAATSPKLKYQALATAWDGIEKASPADIKPSATAVKNAFTKAATQSDADATATVRSVSAHSAKITKYVATNCSTNGGSGGPGGRGGDDHGPMDPAKAAKARECMAKEGVTIAEGSRPNMDDPKVQAAAKKCGLPMRGRGPGGPRGPLSDAVRACLKAKGVTIPEQPKSNGTPPKQPSMNDPKVHDAMEACGVGKDH